MTRGRLATVLLVLGVVALVALPLLVDPTAEYAGSDSQATAVLEEEGRDPWFEAVFTPSSPSVESGLFALQAALGGGALGYVLGRLRGRRLAARSQRPPEDP